MKTKIKAKIILLSGLAFINLLIFQNCSNNMAPMDLDAQASMGVSGSDTQALSLLGNKCASCHSESVAMGDINYITDVPSLKYFRLVIPHQAAASPLYTVLISNENHMSILKQAEAQMIFDWIQNMDSTAGTAPVIIPLGPSFKSISANILGTRCTSCHSGPNPSGGRNFTTFAGVSAVVNPNNADGSLIVQRITRTPGTAGFMPNGSTVPLTPAEIQAIKDWINAGAQNN